MLTNSCKKMYENGVRAEYLCVENIEMPFWLKIAPLGSGLSSLLLVLWEMEARTARTLCCLSHVFLRGVSFTTEINMAANALFCSFR